MISPISFLRTISFSRGTFFAMLITMATVFGIKTAFGNGGDEIAAHNALLLLFLGIALLASKIGSLVERLGQPAVLGELLMGVLLGNLVLVGFDGFEKIADDEIMKFLASLGVIFLLFQTGLESNVKKMLAVGGRAFMIACLGVILPFLLGAFVAGPLLMPGLSHNAYLLFGAALTATSIGISASIFRDMKKQHTVEAKTVIGVAVIDDILGLIILAVMMGIMSAGGGENGSSGSIDPVALTLIAGKAIGFLVGSIAIGQVCAPTIGKIFAKIHTGVGMKFTLAVIIGLGFAYLASLAGLAPLIGAYAAGLVLDPVHFRYFKDPHIAHDIKECCKGMDKEHADKVTATIEGHTRRHIEDLVEPLTLFFAPIFFVMTGMSVDLTYLGNPAVVLTALGAVAVLIVSKLLASTLARGSKLVVAAGTLPRGEVTLVFAATGLASGVFDNTVFSTVVITVLLTTIITPPILSAVIKRVKLIED